MGSMKCTLTLKIPPYIYSRRHFFFFCNKRTKTLRFMWIICWQMIHTKWKSFFAPMQWKMSSATVVIGAFRVIWLDKQQNPTFDIVAFKFVLLTQRKQQCWVDLFFTSDGNASRNWSSLENTPRESPIYTTKALRGIRAHFGANLFRSSSGPAKETIASHTRRHRIRLHMNLIGRILQISSSVLIRGGQFKETPNKWVMFCYCSVYFTSLCPFQTTATILQWYHRFTATSVHVQQSMSKVSHRRYMCNKMAASFVPYLLEISEKLGIRLSVVHTWLCHPQIGVLCMRNICSFILILLTWYYGLQVCVIVSAVNSSHGHGLEMCKIFRWYPYNGGVFLFSHWSISKDPVIWQTISLDKIIRHIQMIICFLRK